MIIGISTSVVQRGKSGVARYVMALVEGLLPYALTDQFILFVLEEDRPLFAFAEGRMTIVTVPERFRPPVRDIVWHQTILPGLARFHRLDVLHVPSYRRMLHHAPCFSVATIHDLAPFRLAGKYDWMRMFYGRVVARRLARRQDRIIAVSQQTAADLGRYFRLKKNRVTVIPNGIDHSIFRPDTGHSAKEWVLQKAGLQKPFFLNIARFEHPAKNHVRLLEAFDRYKKATDSPWQLVLGGSDWHGAETIHERIRQSPYRDHIHVLGFVADSDLPRWYQAADVFVFPSLFEGFGLPPLEAMACGCPVLSSTRGALKEALGDAAVTVDPEDFIALQHAMTAMADDPEWRARLRSGGLVQAERFSWERTAAATLKIYHSPRLQLGSQLG